PNHPDGRARHAAGDGARRPHHRLQLRRGAGRRSAGGNPEQPARAGGLSQDMSAPGPSAEPLITVDGLHTYYGKSHILHGVSLAVGRGEVVGLLGRNGVGKSPTLKSIMGLVNPRRGTLRLGTTSIAGMPSHKLAKLAIS